MWRSLFSSDAPHPSDAKPSQKPVARRSSNFRLWRSNVGGLNHLKCIEVGFMGSGRLEADELLWKLLFSGLERLELELQVYSPVRLQKTPSP